VVGALKRATFRNLILLPTNLKMDDQHRLYLDLEQPIELVSLTGWITNKEGERCLRLSSSFPNLLEDNASTKGLKICKDLLLTRR
jgi:hypothetical protein